jgi:UDP-N-acetyl-2-amino-2-deoxyglucuronate dehydrogenase
MKVSITSHCWNNPDKEEVNMQEKKLRLGIIGCGTISKWHAEAILNIPGAELEGVTDANEEAKKSFAEKYNVKAYSSSRELLNSLDIDAVCICTPSGLHAPLAVEAAEAGKHIVIEKPMAITEGQIRDIICACEKNKVKVEVISQLRFLPSVQKIKAAVEKGLLGKIVACNLDMKFYRSPEYFSSSNWRGTWALDGGGALMNQGIHGVDLMLYAMGSVKKVFAFSATMLRDIEVEDMASAVVEFENGAQGLVQASTCIYPGSQRRLEICGEKGIITLEGNSITRWEIENSQPVDLSDIAVDNSETFRDPKLFNIEGHIKQISDMVEAVLDDRKPFVDQYEGKKAVELILGIYRSAAKGSVINL